MLIKNVQGARHLRSPADPDPNGDPDPDGSPGRHTGRDPEVIAEDLAENDLVVGDLDVGAGVTRDKSHLDVMRGTFQDHVAVHTEGQEKDQDPEEKVNPSLILWCMSSLENTISSAL